MFLLFDYHAKLRLQESRFLGRREHLQNKVSTLRRRLDQEVKHRQVALDAQAFVEEAGAEKAIALVEEKSRDLLGQAASDVFNHLLRLDLDFYFAAALAPVPEVICAAMAKWVEVHVEDLVTRLAPESHGMDSGDGASS
ncbi:hypothetical protein D1007_30480 [Hordeum vulgare]|nr:hypothetical protein D1007_30480 [Hordeum vulgare]